MLTGQTPFDAEMLVRMAMKHVNARVHPPENVNPTVCAGISAVRVMAKDPFLTSLMDDYGAVLCANELTAVEGVLEQCGGIFDSADTRREALGILGTRRSPMES